MSNCIVDILSTIYVIKRKKSRYVAKKNGQKNSKFAKNFTQIQQVQQIPGTRNMKEAISRYAIN